FEKEETMRRSFASVILASLVVALPAAQTPSSRTFDVYLIDVEGAGATLFVAPSGESVLIDTGNGGAAAGRDAGRIMDAVKDGGRLEVRDFISEARAAH